MPHLKIVTFNIRHAKGTDGSVSLDRVAKTLAAIKADIICLQEADRFIPRSFLQDQPKSLAQTLGMEYAFAPTLRFNPMALFGNALLSKFKIVEQGNVLLPGKGEKRGLQHCALAFPGGEKFLVFNTHLGLSQAERSEQVKAIVAQLEKYDCPLILAGDFNSPPEAEELRLLAAKLRCPCSRELYTFPADNPCHAVDHFYTSCHWNIGKVHTHPSQASDHLPLVCSLALTRS